MNNTLKLPETNQFVFRIDNGPDKEVGKLFLKDGKISFEGSFDESGQKFADYLVKVMNAQIKERVQEIINTLPDEEKMKISDGYHTFEELYDHRHALWVNYLNQLEWLVDTAFAGSTETTSWKSKKNHAGEEWEGWFLAGNGYEAGKQKSYHLPMKYWDMLNVIELEKAPDFDGHNSKDVEERLLEPWKK